MYGAAQADGGGRQAAGPASWGALRWGLGTAALALAACGAGRHAPALWPVSRLGGRVAVDFLRDANHEAHGTQGYRNVPDGTLIVRRGGTVRLQLATAEAVADGDVAVTLVGCVGEAYWADGGCQQSAYPADKMQHRVAGAAGRAAAVQLVLADDAPLGRYTLSVRLRKLAPATVVLVVLADAASKADDVYLRSDRQEYVDNEEGLIWQGLSDDNTAHRWHFAHLDWQQLDVALDLLRRMPLPERGDAALLARHLTFSLGNDVCVGKWGKGSYTSGTGPSYRCSKCSKKGKCGGELALRCTEPGDWTGTGELFAVFRASGNRAVQPRPGL